MTPEVSSLREFLVSLPRLASYKYNPSIEYLLWKTLDECVKNGLSSVNWLEKEQFFASHNWENGAYQALRLPENWRDSFFDATAKEGLNHAGSSCNKLCSPTETVFYCFDCTKNPLYEICERCFDARKHEGHRFTSRVVTRPEGRSCHCGDPSGFNSGANALLCKNEANNQERTPNYNYDSNLTCVFEQVLDYLVDTIIFLKELYEEPNKTVMSIGDGCPETTSPTYVLQLYESDCSLHIKDLAYRISLVLNKPIEFGLMMAEKLQQDCSFVTLVECADPKKLATIQDAFVSENITLHVKATNNVFKEYLIDEIINWLYKLCLYNPPLSLKLSLRLALSGTWNSGLLSTKHTPHDLSPFASKIALLGGFVVPFEQRETFPWPKPWGFPLESDGHHDPKILQIMYEYDKRLQETNSSGVTTRFASILGSRLQTILVEEAALLPKIARFRILKIISSIFTIIDDSRKCIAAQYVDVYPNLLYNAVACDSYSQKVSLMSSLSQHIFQVPEIANMVISSGFIERVVQFAFTLMSFSPEELTECPPVPLYGDFKLPTDMIKNKRSVVCFKDIYLLMSTNTQPEMLLTNESITQCMIRCFSAFNNVLPLRRETTEHVEFENFEFSSYFFYFSSILVMVDGFIRNICLLEDPHARRRIVRRFLKLSLSKEFELLGTAKFLMPDKLSMSCESTTNHGLRVINEKVCNTASSVIQFQVGIDCQSFFNPMSYFFKFVTLWSQCGRYEPLPYNFSEFFDVKEVFGDRIQMNWMCESALSTIVLLAQINVGFWVRNGSPVQHQARMYTKYSMREFTYFSDIFMLQLAMSIADPNEFMVTFLTRWGLKNWSEGVPIGDYPEAEITAGMVDQLLLLLIQLFSEIRSLTMKSSVEGFEKTMQMEIVHALCFKNSTHSEILNLIPEHVTKHPAFDLYLREMADYTPPNGSVDAGVYSLKEKYFSLIDPYFIGFSPSKRFEAEKLVRKKMCAERQMEYNMTYVPARDLTSHLKETPYRNLFQICSTEIFGCFLKNTLDHINKFNYESMLSKATHLIHLCVVNDLFGFTNIFWKEYGFSNSEYLYNSSIGSLLYSFLYKEEFVNEHGKIREIFQHFMMFAPHVNIEGYLSEQTPSFNFEILKTSLETTERRDDEYEKRKQLAKSKRDKIMKRIAKQQQKFLANNQMSLEDEHGSVCKNRDHEESQFFPEMTCVFCKMHRVDDTFIYFAYLERNICDAEAELDWELPNVPIDAVTKDFSISYSNTGSRNVGIDQGPENASSKINVFPVLRTCSHGSHVCCLTSHMKSVRTVHNHITKNIPSSLGFSLMFCPLCSALTNSFLPRICGDSSVSASNGFESINKNEPSESSLKNCDRSVAVLRELIDVNDGGSPVEVLSYIYRNTLRNAELATRLKRPQLMNKKECPDFATHQQLLTLRLLSDLRRIYSRASELGDRVATEDHSFLPLLSKYRANQNSTRQECEFDLLSLADHRILNTNFGSKACIKEFLSEFINKGLHHDFLAICGRLSEANARGAIIGNHQSQKETSFTSSEENHVFKILKKYLSSISNAELAVVDLATSTARNVLKDSMIIRIRRFFALLYFEGAQGLEFDEQVIDFGLLDDLLKGFGLPDFTKLLQDYVDKSLEKMLRCIELALEEQGEQEFMKNAKALKLGCFKKTFLICLPQSYSEFMSNEDHFLQMRAKKQEIAICLFCGSRVHVQSAVLLHNYSIGECTNHSLNVCTVNPIYGCFLLVRSNTVYLSYGHRGTFYQAPYLNTHGETDDDYRNGAPVFLDRERYLHLSQDVILNNMVPHLVFRLTENTLDLGGWESM
ncbi:LAQU0S05e00914g1_1 [Lachancea quebecensis]|uniref:E3 ubiquitin-protein ligase n=1 Tax=Lachancea quebecensis TaxID=1654605 RepID=A0A0P1KRG4_9SACH|nr:LAQU0S05e00914g1_1 [Lachancea quebecensis]